MFQTLIILAVSWAVTEIMIWKINYKCSIIDAEQLNARLINLSNKQF
jgi:hypothetical protein